MSTLSPRQMFELDLACHPISQAFSGSVYLVGTAQAPRDATHPPRDVDVRCILDDKTYDALAAAVGHQAIFFFGLAIGRYLASLTGLPIDFQMQRQTEANELHYGKTRNPVGLRSLVNFEGDATPADWPQRDKAREKEI